MGLEFEVFYQIPPTQLVDWSLDISLANFSKTTKDNRVAVSSR